jgi:aspartyl-tRNA synthetase
MEMSFVEEEDVHAVVDGLLQSVLAVAGIEIDLPLERLTYDDAMLRYGTDKPDRRPGMEIHDLGDAFAGSEFKVFAGALEAGGVIRGLRATGEFPRSRLDELTDEAKALGAKGLVWATIEADGDWRSPVAKFLSPEERARAAQALGAGPGDTLFAVADAAGVAARVLGALRLRLAGPRQGHDVFWVVDFPMFEWNATENRLDPLHHPFTAPAGELDGDPSGATARVEHPGVGRRARPSQEVLDEARLAVRVLAASGHRPPSGVVLVTAGRVRRRPTGAGVGDGRVGARVGDGRVGNGRVGNGRVRRAHGAST